MKSGHLTFNYVALHKRTRLRRIDLKTSIDLPEGPYISPILILWYSHQHVFFFFSKCALKMKHTSWRFIICKTDVSRVSFFSAPWFNFSKILNFEIWKKINTFNSHTVFMSHDFPSSRSGTPMLFAEEIRFEGSGCIYVCVCMYCGHQ